MSIEHNDTKYEEYFKDKIKRPTSVLASECSKGARPVLLFSHEDACKLTDKPPDVTELERSCIKSENEISRSDDEDTCSELGQSVLENETTSEKSLHKMIKHLDNSDSCVVNSTLDSLKITKELERRLNENQDTQKNLSDKVNSASDIVKSMLKTEKVTKSGGKVVASIAKKELQKHSNTDSGPQDIEADGTASRLKQCLQLKYKMIGYSSDENPVVKLASTNKSHADQYNAINPHVPKDPKPSTNYSTLAKKEVEGVAKRNERIKLSNPPSILRKSKQTHEPMETEVDISVSIKTQHTSRKYTQKKIHRVKLQGSIVISNTLETLDSEKTALFSEGFIQDPNTPFCKDDDKEMTEIEKSQSDAQPQVESISPKKQLRQTLSEHLKKRKKCCNITNEIPSSESKYIKYYEYKQHKPRITKMTVTQEPIIKQVPMIKQIPMIKQVPRMKKVSRKKQVPRTNPVPILPKPSLESSSTRNSITVQTWPLIIPQCRTAQLFPTASHMMHQLNTPSLPPFTALSQPVMQSSPKIPKRRSRKSKKSDVLESKSHDDQMFAQPHTALPLQPSSRPSEFPSTFQALSLSNFDPSIQYSYVNVMSHQPSFSPSLQLGTYPSKHRLNADSSLEQTEQSHASIKDHLPINLLTAQTSEDPSFKQEDTSFKQPSTISTQENTFDVSGFSGENLTDNSFVQQPRIELAELSPVDNNTVNMAVIVQNEPLEAATNLNKCLENISHTNSTVCETNIGSTRSESTSRENVSLTNSTVCEINIGSARSESTSKVMSDSPILVIKSVYSLADKGDNSNRKLRQNDWYVKRETSHFLDKSRRYLKLLGVKKCDNSKDLKLYFPCFVVLEPLINTRGKLQVHIEKCSLQCKQKYVNNLCTNIAKKKILRTRRVSQHVYKKRNKYSNGTLKPLEVHSQEGENPETNISTGEMIRLLQHVLLVNICENVSAKNTHLPSDIKELVQLLPMCYDAKGETFKEVKIVNQSFIINTKELESGNLCEILNKQMQEKQLAQNEQINGAKSFTLSDMSDYTDDSSVVVSDSSNDDDDLFTNESLVLKSRSNLTNNASSDPKDPPGLISIHTYYKRSSSPWSDVSDCSDMSTEAIPNSTIPRKPMLRSGKMYEEFSNDLDLQFQSVSKPDELVYSGSSSLKKICTVNCGRENGQHSTNRISSSSDNTDVDCTETDLNRHKTTKTDEMKDETTYNKTGDLGMSVETVVEKLQDFKCDFRKLFKQIHTTQIKTSLKSNRHRSIITLKSNGHENDEHSVYDKAIQVGFEECNAI